jgi:colanic acid biosynthesis glycosyl transferase WcaI
MAGRTVVLSGDMKRTVVDRGVDPNRIVVINNFDPYTSGIVTLVATSERGDVLRVIFAGNLGRFQGLDVVLGAARLLEAEPIVFSFVGDGVARAELEVSAAALGLKNVTFLGYRPADEVEQILREKADVGLITLASGVIWAAFPSKTFSYLGQGCPVVAAVEAESELAAMVTGAGVGFAVPPRDAAALANALRIAAADQEGLADMRRKAVDFSIAQLSLVERLREWRSLFDSIATERQVAVLR